MKMLKSIAKLLTGKQTDTNDVSIDNLNSLNTSLLKTNEKLMNEWAQIKP